MTLSKNTIKFVKSLHLKKFRQKYDKFIVEGDKIATEMLCQSRFAISALYALPEWLEEKNSEVSKLSNRAQVVSERELSQISTMNSPNKVLIIASKPVMDQQLPENISSCLYLDGIQDPGNFGTILRIADWFGVKYVFSSDQSVDFFNPKVIQASMGSFIRVENQECSLAALKKQLPQHEIWGAGMKGQNAFSVDWPKKCILVIGNEGYGIGSETQEMLQKTISIPKAPEGGAESLNAAVATGILCALMRAKADV